LDSPISISVPRRYHETITFDRPELSNSAVDRSTNGVYPAMANDDKTSDSSAMMSRFSGPSGHDLLLEVLEELSLLRGVPGLPQFLDGCEVLEVPEGSRLIEQGASDNFIFVIVSGSVDILVNGRRVATRSAGCHVGEMALIDPSARRSATVVTTEPSVVIKATEQHFSSYANTQPRLWRRIAVELSRRLAERSRFIKTPRTEPVVFVACSTEALPIARELHAAFDHDPAVVEIWTNGIFNASKTPIEDLTELVGRIDFAIILLTPDDKIFSRDVETFGPRDNVIFELGLAIGAIGRSRTLLVCPRGADFKLPTDLLGVKPIDYPTGELSTIQSRLGPACNEIRKIINRLGPL
jgi:predicted nucleotide-binding protein